MSTSTPLAWLAGAMLLFSCNKDHISPGGTAPETSAETVFPVTFDAGGFTQQLDSFGRKADATLLSLIHI